MIPTTDTIQRASTILAELEALQAELTGLFTGGARAASGAAKGPKRRGRPPGSRNVVSASAVVVDVVAKPARRMSAAGRARIAAAAKARWAKFHAEQGVKASAAKATAAPAPARKPSKKGGMSAAGRAAIVAAQKARWAKIRAAKKQAARA